MGGAAAVLGRARQASARLHAAGWPRRRGLLRALRLRLAEGMDGVAGAMSASSGRPLAEILLSEIYPALHLLKYYERSAGAVLAGGRVPTPFFFRGCSSRIEYRPHGAVVIAGPYNFPLQLTLLPAITAVAAGNAAVVKPSELAPGTGDILSGLFRDAGVPEGILQTVEGGPEALRELVEAGPDYVFYTGGSRGGREVMRLCAARPVPLTLELGGKSPLLVFGDADIGRAAQGAAYGAFCNAGQVCMAAGRIYVERRVYADFCRAFAAACALIRPGTDYGPLASGALADRVEAQAREAGELGGRRLTPARREGLLLWPAAVADAPADCALMTEETFGPAVGLRAFDTEEEALALANAGDWGLAASVWTSDPARARRIVSGLEAGFIAVNDAIRPAGSPFLPFGGVKGSGFGRYHGAEGLLALSRVISVAGCSGTGPSELHWFPYGERLYPAMLEMMKASFGKFSPRAWLAAGRAFRAIAGLANRRLDDF